jgi:C1A family cysteine protease
MKLLVIFLLIASACAQLNPTFEQWQVEHGKKFNFFERLFFRKVFNTNKADVDAHNENSENSYQKSLNEFSHITTEEFISTRCRTVVPPESRSRAATTVKPQISSSSTTKTTTKDASTTTKTPAVALDYSNLMQPVQYQGACGGCYAFATMAQIEGRMRMKNSTFNSTLSPQFILDCDTFDSGCNYGWPTSAMSK